MAVNKPQHDNEGFPVPTRAYRPFPMWTIFCGAGLLALIILLALSY